MRVDQFDFELPEDLIALEPARPRDSARLLCVRPGADPEFADRRISDLPELLAPGDLLVVNDTRVIPAHLSGTRSAERGTAHVELTLHKRVDSSTWRAFARPAKRLRPGDRITFGHEGRVCLEGTLAARVAQTGEGGEVTLAFEFHGPVLDSAIAQLGNVPLPPYIAARRAVRDSDETDYQTLFAEREGAVAAPTAGLHFTPALLRRLEKRGIGIAALTLHVGAGTFLPVKAADTDSHRMHAEWGEIGRDAAERINRTRAQGGRIVALGTTALRLLESAAEPSGEVHPFSGETDIFIKPGYAFRAVDRLLTNFHLPRSTLFMLVAAFSGLEVMRDAYQHAIAQRYRFYSYGDACLLEPAGARP